MLTNNNGRSSSKIPNSRMIILLLFLIICLLGLSFDYFTADYYYRSSSCGVNYVFVEATTSKNKKKKKKTNTATQQHHLVEFTLPHVPIHHDYDGENENNKNTNIANTAAVANTANTVAAIIPKIELNELNSFINDATSYLIRINHSSKQDSTFPGRFTYITYTNQNLNISLNNDNYWNESKNYQNKYNLLRHNGAIYALSQAYFRKQKLQQKSKKHNKKKIIQNKNNEEEDNIINSDLLLQTIKNGIGYLRDNALLSPPPGSKNNYDNNIVWLAAWERTDINDPQSIPTTAKLGGAGLALISLGSLYQIDSNQVSLKNELRPIGNFIESLQNIQDGSFTCKYQWSTGKDDSWQSLYYPGEAALGLVLLAEIELKNDTNENSKKQREHEQRSNHWMQLASNTLLYLERYRRNQQLHQIEPDHWSLLATSKLLPLLDQQRKNVLSLQRKKQLDIEYWLIYNHGIKVATSMVSDHTTKQLITNHGCFSSDMRTCPTSTRLEGLLATLTFIKKSEIYMGDEGLEDGTTELLRDRIEYDVAMGIRFLLNAQHKSNHHNMRGAMPGKYVPPITTTTTTTTTNKSNLKKLVDIDNGDEENEEEEEEEEQNMTTEVRVDYVQHSMSAVIAYESYLLKKQQRIIDDESGTKKSNFKNKVRGVADHITKHIRSKIHNKNNPNATNDTLANFALLGILMFFVLIIIYIAYMPSLLSSSSLKRLFNTRRGKRRIKRKD